MTNGSAQIERQIEQLGDAAEELRKAARLAGKREAAAALGKWLRHVDGCCWPNRVRIWQPPDYSKTAMEYGDVCTCGLSAALEALNG